MTRRQELIAAVLARAADRGVRVFGYDTRKPKSDAMWLNARKGVPDDWNRICAERDPEWTRLPRPGDDE